MQINCKTLNLNKNMGDQLYAHLHNDRIEPDRFIWNTYISAFEKRLSERHCFQVDFLNFGLYTINHCI